MNLTRRNQILIGIGIIVIGFVILQFIPFGNFIPVLARTNPPVKSQIVWNSPETEQLVRTTCYSCHSNETEWPFYAYVAPMSWLVLHDVNEARQKLNFSEETADQIDPSVLVEQIDKGNMPPIQYLLLHPEARLTDAQKETLRTGLRASLHGFQ